jgi:hypothetical protein
MKRYQAVSRHERQQAELFYADLTGASRGRRRRPAGESAAEQPGGPPSQRRVSDDELVSRAERAHHENVQVMPLVRDFLFGRVRIRNRISMGHHSTQGQAFLGLKHPATKTWMLSVGSSFVYRLAKREIRPLVREAAAAIQQVEWGVYLDSPLKPRESTFRVILVARQGHPPGIWAGARRVVEEELDAVAAESGRAAVATGFEVVVRNELTATQVAAFDRRDLVAYVVGQVPSRNVVLKIVRQHLRPTSDEQEQEAVNGVIAQMEAEGGANVGLGEREVSFISTAVYMDQFQHQGGHQEARRGAAQRIAELALHEIGHGLGAPHDGAGIMMERAAASISDAGRRFSPASRIRIRARLEQLAPR